MTVEIEENLDLVEQVEKLEENMAGLEHGAIGVRLISYLFNYVYPNELGEVFEAQTTFKVKGKPSTRQPDVSFVTKDRLPKNFRIEADFAPDLAVEIVSKNDKDFDNDEKVLQYQKSGVRLIWLVHPVSQSVEVYRLASGIKSQRLAGEDELSGEDVIPGFRLKVSTMFERIPIVTDNDEL